MRDREKQGDSHNGAPRQRDAEQPSIACHDSVTNGRATYRLAVLGDNVSARPQAEHPKREARTTAGRGEAAGDGEMKEAAGRPYFGRSSSGH